VIELCSTWLQELGLRDLTLELNSIGDAKCRPVYLDLLRAYYRPFKDQLHGECQARLETNPLLLLDCKVPQDQQFKVNAPRVTDHLCDECAAAWAAVRRLLDAARIPYHVDPHLVRGLDYYTRTVFEFYPAGPLKAQGALAAGGRYDGLAEAEGWPATPGVGFASGLDRVTEQVAASGAEVIAAPPAEVMVLADASLEVEAAQVARICRSVRSVAVDFEPKSLKAKMRSAHKLGARWVVLLSEDEATRRVAQLRDMASGEQVEVAWDQLPERLT
jgi:histidyl-tRNA synthetase